jgi:hypothetical protein
VPSALSIFFILIKIKTKTTTGRVGACTYIVNLYVLNNQMVLLIFPIHRQLQLIESYKGKVKTHKCINRQNQSTTENGEILIMSSKCIRHYAFVL